MLNAVLMSLALLGSPTPVTQTDPPIACQPKALDTVQRKRQKELLETVRGKIQKTTEPVSNAAAVPSWSSPSSGASTTACGCA